MTADPQDTCRPGNPDPTATHDAYCPDTRGLYQCTRTAGHTGQHVAGGLKDVCATWTDDGPLNEREEA